MSPLQRARQGYARAARAAGSDLRNHGLALRKNIVKSEYKFPKGYNKPARACMDLDPKQFETFFVVAACFHSIRVLDCDFLARFYGLSTFTAPQCHVCGFRTWRMRVRAQLSELFTLISQLCNLALQHVQFAQSNLYLLSHSQLLMITQLFLGFRPSVHIPIPYSSTWNMWYLNI